MAAKAFLLSAPEVNDPKKLRETLRNLILVRVVILSILLGASSWGVLTTGSFGLQTYIIFWTFALTYAISLLNAWWLRYTKHPLLLGYAQLSCDAALSTIAIYITGSSASITLYLLVIVAAALVFSRHGALILAAIAGVCYAILASGILPDEYGNSTLASTADFIGTYISLVLVAILSGYLANQLEIVGSLADETSKSLEKLSKQKNQLFNDISDGIITLDVHSAITSINEAARAIIGLTRIGSEELLGRPLDEVFAKQGLSGAHHILSADESSSAVGTEVTLSSPDEAQGDLHLHCSVKELHDEEGNTSGSVVIFNDVSHVRDMEERLELHERMTQLLAEVQDRAQDSEASNEQIRMIGESGIMKDVFSLVKRVASSDASVLVTGESGTGKELIAKGIHFSGERRSKRFIAINCGAIPENLIESELFGHKKGAFTGAVTDKHGLFREADGGTLFLDEIGELPLLLQSKLLRALQEKTIRPVGDTHDINVDVRIVAATNRDLKAESTNGTFREDLYYRLNVVNIDVPPLRQRRGDIPLLVRHFIASMTKAKDTLPQISPDALRILTAYSFPGNIRELENIIERALVLGGSAILPEHLPNEVILCSKNTTNNDRSLLTKAAGDKQTEIVVLPINLESELEKLERQYLREALEQAAGIKKHAAELLGLNFRSFRYRLKKYGLGDGA